MVRRDRLLRLMNRWVVLVARYAPRTARGALRRARFCKALEARAVRDTPRRVAVAPASAAPALPRNTRLKSRPLPPDDPRPMMVIGSCGKVCGMRGYSQWPLLKRHLPQLQWHSLPHHLNGQYFPQLLPHQWHSVRSLNAPHASVTTIAPPLLLMIVPSHISSY